MVLRGRLRGRVGTAGHIFREGGLHCSPPSRNLSQEKCGSTCHVTGDQKEGSNER